MGLMDKVKQQAEHALQMAQQGVSQGQAKLDQVQAKRRADALLRNLGAAYFAEKRHGGPADAVGAAMTALDEHETAHGPIDTGAVVVDVTDSPSPAEGSALGGDGSATGSQPGSIS